MPTSEPPLPTTPLFPLNGLRALVTGASRGIGRAISVALAGQGAAVRLVSRGQAALEALQADIGQGARALPVDLTSHDAAQTVWDAVDGQDGGLDILVHCAGEYLQRPVADSTIEDLDRLYRSNVRAPYALTLKLLPLLKQAQGQIVFVNSSITTAANLAERGPFASTQYALRALANGLRDEVNPDGVRVVSVYPGTTATPRAEQFHADRGQAYAPEFLLQPEDVAEAVRHVLTLPRTAEVTDLYLRPMKKAPDR